MDGPRDHPLPALFDRTRTSIMQGRFEGSSECIVWKSEGMTHRPDVDLPRKQLWCYCLFLSCTMGEDRHRVPQQRTEWFPVICKPRHTTHTETINEFEWGFSSNPRRMELRCSQYHLAVRQFSGLVFISFERTRGRGVEAIPIVPSPPRVWERPKTEISSCSPGLGVDSGSCN